MKNSMVSFCVGFICLVSGLGFVMAGMLFNGMLDVVFWFGIT